MAPSSKSDDTEIVVTFNERDQSRTSRAVMSGFCQLHWGVLSLGLERQRDLEIRGVVSERH